MDTLPVNERCKIEPVQSELAIIQAYKDTFDQLPGIVLGVVYGLLADRVGRKPILLCGMLGLALSGLWVKVVCWFPDVIPLKMVYLSAPILIFGGGAQVASSMFFVMLADSYSEEERATSFFYFSAVVLTAEILATPISGLTMTEDPWLPFLLSSGVEFLALVVAILFAPETLCLMRPKSSGASRSSTTDSDESTTPTKEIPFVRTVVAKITDSLNLIKESTHFLSTNLNVGLLLLVFFVATLSRQAMALLLQYATKKYHWSYSKATLLVSVRGAVNLAAVLVILPFLSRLLLKRLKLDAPSKDLWLSRGTAFLLTIGMLLMFSAPAPAILIIGLVAVALGSPLHLTARSLITSLVLPNQVGVLYTSLAVVQSVGILIAGPLLANTFRWGMKLGDTWLGLPFLAAAVMYLLSFLLISVVNLSRRPLMHSIH
ncbi:hypothetical protein ZTR_01496 [Talaromyces verruculosus]|nr:hypothetical protein ZTR_01496 [Talaromyces verruculosus]